MKARLIGVVLLSALLGACAAPAVWTRPGLTQTEWLQDQFACESATRAARASFGSIYTRDYHAKQFNARCLQSKGYSLAQ